MAGIAAGNGLRSDGKYAGLAPECDVVAVKTLEKGGAGNSADVLAGLQWVADNRARYNIRVVNLSIGTGDAVIQDPLVRAVDALWDKGVIVVAAAGNNGPSARSVTSPGISRKVITVGALSDRQRRQVFGNSGRGPTKECIVKPDMLAPGGDIVSCLTLTMPRKRAQSAKAKIISPYYIAMSGTSMATPIVSGAIALLLQKHPNLTPNEVKIRLKKSCVSLDLPQNQQGWGLVNVADLLGL